MCCTYSFLTAWFEIQDCFSPKNHSVEGHVIVVVTYVVLTAISHDRANAGSR